MNKYTLNLSGYPLWYQLAILHVKEIMHLGLYGEQKRRWLMRIKLIVLLITAGLIQVSAAGFAQRVTLSEKGTTLKAVLQKLRSQTGYDFLYKAEVIKKSAPLNVDFRDVRLEEALGILFKNSNLQFSIEKKVVVIEEKLPSFLDRVISGLSSVDVVFKINDEKGNPMPGATVVVKGTGKRVASNSDGVVVLNNIDENAIIMVSFTGYATQEISVKKIHGSLKMSLASTNLDEVKVNTGYGIVRDKKELGYSTGTVTGEELNKANSGNILSGLSGKISGLNIMTQSTSLTPQFRILLRGIRSFGDNSSNQPLFVFNGAPISFGSGTEAAARVLEFINNLNPADVEEVTVLKGANGTAMYGPEGVNGVILITTKKPKSGEVAVNFRINSSVSGVDYSNYAQQRSFGAGDNNGIYNGRSIQNWGPAYNGSMVPIGFPDENGKTQMVRYEDREDKFNFYDHPVSTRINASLSSGDANSSYYLGIGHVISKGLIAGDKSSQTNLSLNSAKKFGKKIDILYNINYTLEDKDVTGFDVAQSVLTIPTFIPLNDYKGYANDHWSGPNNYWNYLNPYKAIDDSRVKSKTNSLSGSLTANLKILPWLNLRDQAGLNLNSEAKKASSYGQKFASYVQDPQRLNEIYPSVDDVASQVVSLNNDLLLNATHQSGDFLFRLTLGNSIRQTDSKIVRDGASLGVPIFNTIYERDNTRYIIETLTKERSFSFFGNVNAGYKNMFFAEFTARTEFDSKRAKASRGKDIYTGVNTSFVMKEIIPWLREQPWLTTFRLRASATRTANLNIDPYAAERILDLEYGFPYSPILSTGFFGNTTGYVLGYNFSLVSPNPNIKPERIFSQEYGAELGFFKNRIKLDATFYTQVNNGVIMEVSKGWMSGYPSLDNAGSLRNSGWEFDLNLNPLVSFSRDFNITVQGRLAINNNMVTKISDFYHGVFTANGGGAGTFYAREGHSAYEFGIVDWKRDPQGRVIVDPKTGLPDYDDLNKTYGGNTLPRFTGGFTVNLNYKRFALSGQADYSGGNFHQFNNLSITNGTDMLTLLNNRERFVMPNSVIETSPGVFVENKDVAVSGVSQEFFRRLSQVNAFTIKNAAYWRIRELALKYDIPVKNKIIKALNASVYATNLFSFYPPDNQQGDPSSVSGPTTKQPQRSLNGNVGKDAQNTAGGFSSPGSLPGYRTFGFILGATL